MAGTVNRGSDVVGAGVFANDYMAFVGRDSTRYPGFWGCLGKGSKVSFISVLCFACGIWDPHPPPYPRAPFFFLQIAGFSLLFLTDTATKSGKLSQFSSLEASKLLRSAKSSSPLSSLSSSSLATLLWGCNVDGSRLQIGDNLVSLCFIIYCSIKSRKA